MSPTLPELNALLLVTCPRDGGLHRTRVESLDAPDLLIAAPHGNADPALPYAGDALTLQWGNARGQCLLPVRFAGLEVSRVLVWRLRAAGEVELAQRRRYARSSAVGKVTLLAEGAEPVVGAAVDISEGGVRCRLPAGRTVAAVGVEVRLDLDGGVDLALPGEVLRVYPGGDGFDEAIVVFLADDRQSDRIRRYVYARQRLERAAERA